jgi:hypothetical protein
MNVDIEAMKTRMYVLEKALNVEMLVTNLVIMQLDIDKEKVKIFGDTSVAFSFKNNIDLLKELQVFSEDEYQQFLCFAEFRNKFMHLEKCDTFVKALGMLTARKKMLEKLTGKNVETEDEIHFAYKTLLISIKTVVMAKIMEKHLKVETAKALINDTRKTLDSFTDAYLELSKFIKDTTRHIEIGTEIGSYQLKLLATFEKVNAALGEIDLKPVYAKYPSELIEKIIGKSPLDDLINSK